MINYDAHSEATYRPTMFENLKIATERISTNRGTGTVKGQGMWMPAAADVTYAVGDGTVRVFVNVDLLTGKFQHRCEVTGQAKCHIDDTPIDKPLQVHIASYKGVDWGENSRGWEPRIRNLTGQNLWQCRLSRCVVPPGETADLETGTTPWFDEEKQAPGRNNASVTDQGSPGWWAADWLGMYFEADVFGRTHHRCSDSSIFQCSVIPSNDDDQGHKQHPVVVVTKKAP
ncbi:hypothetical protein LQL77_31455 [Rhodococcus cerastii]|nr:hypothetical protein [Rhodococcus cerastii]